MLSGQGVLVGCVIGGGGRCLPGVGMMLAR